MYDPEKAHYIVATCILVKNGRFLIAKRASFEKAFPNLWTVPGGKLELSEYKNRKMDTSCQWYNIFENLVIREVEEEVGLKIKNIKYLTSLAYIRDDGIPTIIASMFAEPAGDDVKLCKALTEHAWVSLEEVKDYELIEGIYEELELLDKHLKGENLGVWSKK